MNYYIYNCYGKRKVKNKIVKIKNLQNIIKEKKEIEEEIYPALNSIFMNIYKLYKKYLFKNKLQEIDYINRKKNLFEWVFDSEECEDENENKE